MEMKPTESGLLVPQEKEKPKGRKTFLFEPHYMEDVLRFCKLIDENPAATLAGVLTVPCFNIWAQKIGTKFAVVYVAAEQMDMEIMT